MDIRSIKLFNNLLMKTNDFFAYFLLKYYITGRFVIHITMKHN